MTKIAAKADELATECARLVKVSAESQKLGAFLEWLRGEKGYELGEWDKYDRLMPVSRRTEDLLAEYFGIDLEQVERERRMLLSALRLDQGR